MRESYSQTRSNGKRACTACGAMITLSGRPFTSGASTGSSTAGGLTFANAPSELKKLVASFGYSASSTFVVLVHVL